MGKNNVKPGRSEMKELAEKILKGELQRGMTVREVEADINASSIQA